ncbi:MAG: TadE/TadG family type IV pilus assembly protein, partial [Candidatus Promineifilaceae bacterium]
MIERIRHRSNGQATVEFALIAGILLVFVFTIIESGRMFQGWLTVQNSARAAGRYALTGSYDTECLYEFPACLDPRVDSIKDESKRTAAGLNINPESLVGEPGSFSTEVWSKDENGTWIPDDSGGAGDPVRVKVTYNMPIVVPVLSAIVESVPLKGQVTVTNEEFDQVATSATYSSPPEYGPVSDDEVPPYSDLEITKSAMSGSVYSGHEISYTVTVQNHGPFDAEDIVVVDTLPATTTYIGAAFPSSGYCDPPVGDTLTCFLPNLAGDGGPGSSVSFIINTLAPTEAPTDPTIVTNVASVSNGLETIDPNLGNNNTSVSLEVIPWADLVISKSDNADPVRISSPLEYTINVLNLELNEAHNVYMEDELPAGVTFVSATSDGPCSYDGLNHVVTCGPVLLLPPGSSTDFSITVTAPPDAGFISNVARTWAEQDDLDPLNNETTESTNVTPAITDLEIYKEGVPFEVYAGEAFTYTIDVYNNGPDDAPVVQIQDLIPAGLSILSSSPTCSEAGNNVVCDVGPIPNAGSTQVSIAVSTTITMVVDNDDTQILNTAEVLWGINQTDPNPGNNTYTAQNFVMPWVDLSIIKTATAQVYDGDLITYTLEVHNDGPFIAEDVRIWDSFPYPEGDTDGRYGSPECSEINSSYAHCQIGDLAIGATYVVTVVAAADWPGDSWNTAEVFAEEDDPYNPDDNEDDALTVILPRTELEVIKHAPSVV